MFDKLKSGLNAFVAKISQKELSEKEITQTLEEFLLVLVENDVAYEVAKRICDKLQVELKEVFRGAYLPEAAVSKGVADLRVGARAFFINGYVKAVYFNCFHNLFRFPKIAVPIRTSVAPSSIATSKSPLMPIESSVSFSGRGDLSLSISSNSRNCLK